MFRFKILYFLNYFVFLKQLLKIVLHNQTFEWKVYCTKNIFWKLDC